MTASESTILPQLKLSGLSFLLFRLVIFLMPASHAVKFILNVPNVVWIEPSLVFGFIAFCLHIFEKRTLSFSPSIVLLGLFTIFYTLTSVTIFAINPSWLPKEGIFLEMLAEPIKLILVFCIFYLAYYYSLNNECRQRIVHLFAITATLQLVLGFIMGIGFYYPLPIPALFQTYIMDYGWRQSYWIGNFPLFRLGGTFIEAPPFGLYMLMTSMIVFYEYQQTKRTKYKWFLCTALLGVILSLSIQTYIALAVFIGIYLLGRVSFKSRTYSKWLRSLAVFFALGIAAVPVLGYVAITISQRIGNVQQIEDASAVQGQSIGERYYHFIASLAAFRDTPLFMLTGIGSRGYGFFVYPYSGEVFPTTTVPQTMLTDIMISSGLIGLTLFILWLLVLFRHLIKLPYLYGLAVWVTCILSNFAQATWKFVPFFFTLAFFMAQQAKKDSLQ